jgi:hypothetical protein
MSFKIVLRTRVSVETKLRSWVDFRLSVEDYYPEIPPQRPPRLNDHPIYTKTANCTFYNSTKTCPFALKLKIVIDLEVSSKITHSYPYI